MVCHSGVLAGGHYISYGKMGNGKWYCQNDSACKVGTDSNIQIYTGKSLQFICVTSNNI